MMKIEGSRVLLTGASGGIGAALADQLAGRGARMVLIGRNMDQLAPLAERLRGAYPQTDVQVQRIDLLDGVARHAGVVDAVRQLGGSICSSTVRA